MEVTCWIRRSSYATDLNKKLSFECEYHETERSTNVARCDEKKISTNARARLLECPSDVRVVPRRQRGNE